MKLSRVPSLAIILILILLLSSIIITGSLSTGFSSEEDSKLKICPDKWYKNKQPCVYKNSPAECEKQQREYFVIDGARKTIEEVDVDWIIKNCEVNQPEVIY